MAKKKMNLDVSIILSKSIILRIALGGMLIISGYLKLKTGTTAFVELAAPNFAHTIIPMEVVKAFLTIIPTAETVIGGLLLLGLFTNAAARLAALLFALYIVALTSQNNAEAGIFVFGLFIYIIAIFKLLCCGHSPISLDHALRCKGGKCTM